MKGRAQSASKTTARSTPKKPSQPAVSRATESLGKKSGESSFCIVAIGASAGGLEAYTDLFHSLSPNTGMAFVLVQHLDPTHGSLLTEILAKATPMQVEEVRSGTRVEPNQVYVIPPNFLMEFANNILHLTPRGKKTPPHGDLAINHFMRSLAQEAKARAIGIVLSGTGSDGTSGLEDIKNAGGMTFAQEPASAKYDGMPRSAIDSGCVVRLPVLISYASTLPGAA